MNNVPAGFPKMVRYFFPGIPPKYPLSRAFKYAEGFPTGNAMFFSPPGDTVVGVPPCAR